MKNNVLNKLALPFGLFLLASGGVVILLPLFASYASAQPTTLQLATTGSLIITFAALFLSYATKIVGLNAGWLVLSVLFTSTMVILKFVLIPRALYTQTFVNSVGSFVPISVSSFLFVAVIFFAIYAGIFVGAYQYYKKKIMGSRKSQKEEKSRYSPKVALTYIGIFVAIALFLLMSGMGAAIFVVLVYASSAFSYAQALVAGGGFVLVVTTLLAILLSVKYLESAANQSVKLKKPALLTIAFWIGFSLLLSFHILWVVFMGILLSIWPFKTITPSSK